MKNTQKYLLIGFGILGIYLMVPKNSKTTEGLVPSFVVKLNQLFTIMRSQGFDPVFANTTRSPESAAKNAQKGTGIEDSMHIYGLAADIVDRKLLWNAPQKFWDALHKAAISLKLTRVHRPDGSWDLPHVQAIPVNKQNQFRALPTIAQREAALRKIYGLS